MSIDAQPSLENKKVGTGIVMERGFPNQFKVLAYRTSAQALAASQTFSDSYPEMGISGHPNPHAPQKVFVGAAEMWVLSIPPFFRHILFNQ
jgi:hypothetical protein